MEKLFYKSIATPTEFEIPKIKGSRFIGNAFFVEDKETAESFVKEISEKYRDATHNCFAYSCGLNTNFDLFGQLNITDGYFKFSDDGEPMNTAGKPILAQIQGQNLHNILIVVTRYFGGTLLGIGGLIQAYAECAKQVILNSQIIDIELTKTKKIKFNYDQMATAIKLLNKYGAKVVNEQHGDFGEIDFMINEGYVDSFSKEIFNQSKGSISI